MKFNTIRAWKDEAYRLSLSSEEQALLPESPVGTSELTMPTCKLSRVAREA